MQFHPTRPSLLTSIGSRAFPGVDGAAVWKDSGYEGDSDSESESERDEESESESDTDGGIEVEAEVEVESNNKRQVEEEGDMRASGIVSTGNADGDAVIGPSANVSANDISESLPVARVQVGTGTGTGRVSARQGGFLRVLWF